MVSDNTCAYYDDRLSKNTVFENLIIYQVVYTI